MRDLSRILVIAGLTLMLSAPLWAQSQLLTNPANLSQFPSVERIKAGTKGTDDVDSHARFMAALELINGMIIRDLITAPNGGEFDVPRAADAVQDQYFKALTRYGIDERPPAARDPRYDPLESKYEKDPVFFDNLLTQFFSPRFRADYYAWVRKPVPKQTATAGGAVKGPPSDPSIAKAKASGMSTTVFGLELGEPLSLPTCAGGLLQMDTRTCVVDQHSGPGAGFIDFLTSAAPSAPKEDPNVFAIHLDENHCPAWVAVSCQAQVLLHDGVVVAIAVSTKGRNVENSVKAELKTKYGSPNMTIDGKITPDVGNAFDVHEPLWLGRGIRVEYQVVIHNETGVDISSGWVRVISETAYDRIANKPVEKKM
jgi:hypothetical protein